MMAIFLFSLTGLPAFAGFIGKCTSRSSGSSGTGTQLQVTTCTS